MLAVRGLSVSEASAFFTEAPSALRPEREKILF